MMRMSFSLETENGQLDYDKVKSHDVVVVNTDIRHMLSKFMFTEQTKSLLKTVLVGMNSSKEKCRKYLGWQSLGQKERSRTASSFFPQKRGHTLDLGQLTFYSCFLLRHIGLRKGASTRLDLHGVH